jgi:hypothetical protein
MTQYETEHSGVVAIGAENVPQINILWATGPEGELRIRKWSQFPVDGAVAYSVAPPTPYSVEGWTKVPADLPLELLKSINYDNQVLAYENGRYYNAWFEFEQSEGGWFWTDEADSEPNPSHYRLLPAAPVLAATTEGSADA